MDNTFVIDNLLRRNESDVLEFKEKYSPEVIAKNVLLNKLLSEIAPSAPFDVQLVEYNGKNILMIRVWEGSQKPYSYKGTIYQKIGNRGKSLSKILSDRKDADINWERLPLLGADLSDLDMEEVKKTVHQLQESGKSMTADTEEFLINNGLIQNGNITNACALLYAKNPSRFYTQSVIRLSVFSSESSSDLVEARNYSGNIFKNACFYTRSIGCTRIWYIRNNSRRK